MRFALLALFNFICIFLLAGNNNIAGNTKQAKEWMRNQPLSFVENKGQFTDSDGNPAENVLFKASYGNCDIYITTKGLSYVFVKQDDKPQKSLDTNTFQNKFRKQQEPDKTISYYRLDMNLEGADIEKATVLKEQPGKQGVTNYFYPHCPDGIYGVQEFGKITIKNIYKGIDWVIYTNPDNKKSPLKYDFVVHQEANYKDIRIKFINAQSTSLIDDGTKLKIQTIAGNIEEGNLYSYLENSQQKQAIKTSYTANADSSLQFEISAYDKTKTLVIDPLVWATYYGGWGDDQFLSICTDSKDNIYITGSVTSLDFPTLQPIGGYWQATKKGQYANVLIIKFNNRGVRQYATYYGGSVNDCGRCIYADKMDNIYVTGDAGSQDFPMHTLTGAYNQQIIGGENASDIFILKFTNMGQRLWATYYGGTFNEYRPQMSGDSQDNIYIIGTSFSTDFPTKQLPGAYNYLSLSNNLDGDGFILKFNSKGIVQWATSYGGNSGDFFFDLSIDSEDNMYVTGDTYSTDFPLQQIPGAYWQATTAGYDDSFILKFDKNGKRLWATYFGGNSIEYGMSLCSDKKDNLYITGFTLSTDFPIQQLSGAYNQPNSGGSFDIFLSKFNSAGVCIWSTYYGGSDGENGTSVCVDRENDIYITGNTYSTDFPILQLSSEYWQPTNAGSDDAIILKFDSLGATKWATYYGGSVSDAGIDMALDKQNSIYIGGRFFPGAYTMDYGNGSYFDKYGKNSYDGFILKIKECNNQKLDSIQTDRNNFCVNDHGLIYLTAIGGAGDTLKWYSDKNGQNYLGKGTPFTVPVPAKTTTYYARWESLCDTSVCDSIVIYIYTQITKNISPVICQGDTCKVGTSKYTTSGIYTDLLFTDSGCDSIVTTNLTVNPAKLIAQTKAICEGETYTVGTNDYNLTGTYTDVLKTYLGCDSTVITNLIVNPIKRSLLSRSICNGESFIVGTKVHTTSGIYSDTLSSVLFCDSIVTTNLTVNLSYQPIPSHSICPGETVIVGTHTYNVSGIYIDKLITMFGCDSIITTNLTVYPVNQNSTNPKICTGESVTVGTNTYTETGTYTDVLVSYHNCDSTVVTNLTVNPTGLNQLTRYICEGETFTVGTNDYSTSGNYIDVLKTSLGCDSTVTTNLTVNPLPLVTLGDDQLLCPGDSIILTPGIGYTSYLWSDGSVLSKLIVTTTGTYSVIVHDEWCPASDDITIKECGSELWFPNAFSPNNDGLNDFFKPVILGTLHTYQLLIYNRWGQQVYESNTAFPGWDGTFGGNLCPGDLYVFVANFSMGAEPGTQKQQVQRGSLTLVR